MSNTHKSKVSLGVVAISYNEEIDLPGFIDNLIDWVDEIIIVDDGSTDNTAQLAADAGDKTKLIVSPRASSEYFSHQRNKGIRESSSDWLLHMDIDERVTPELATEILRAIESEKFQAYRFRRINYFLHRPMKRGGWADWNLVHLARRDVLSFGGMFHESCDLSIDDTQIGQLLSHMHHLNDKSFKARLTKSNTYLEETVVREMERGRRVTGFSIIARPISEFVRKYFIKLGMLDGVPGLISALHSSTAVFRTMSLVWEQQNLISRSILEKNISERWEGRQLHSDD